MSRYGFSDDLSSAEKSQVLECYGAQHSPWVDLCHRVGIPAVEGVMDTFGGLKVHVPQRHAFWTDLRRGIRNREIRARHDGRNLRQLVAEYGLSERQVRNILLEHDSDQCCMRVLLTCRLNGHG